MFLFFGEITVCIFVIEISFSNSSIINDVPTNNLSVMFSLYVINEPSNIDSITRLMDKLIWELILAFSIFSRNSITYSCQILTDTFLKFIKKIVAILYCIKQYVALI